MGLRSLPGSALQTLSPEVRSPISDGAGRLGEEGPAPGRLRAQEELVPGGRLCRQRGGGLAACPLHSASQQHVVHGELPARATSITICNNTGSQL